MHTQFKDLLETPNITKHKPINPPKPESSKESHETVKKKKVVIHSKYLSHEKFHTKDEMSDVKRERIQRKDTAAYVQCMRKNLPEYTMSEIREFKLPFHEALIINLQESGYESASSYIRELIEYQENIRKSSGPGSNIFVLPQLKFAKEQLAVLSQYLKNAEKYHHDENYNNECEEFLNLAVIFGFGQSDWWWLGEQLLLQSIRVSSEYSPNIGHRFEALSRYTYARFLLDNVKESENAAKQLKIARVLSQNKVWTSKIYFPEVRGTLYMQTNRAIFECLVKDVKTMMNTDMDKAMLLADQARKRASEACFRNGETRALVLKGICELETKRAKSAINSFLRALGIQQRWGTIEGICKIKIHLAKAYLMDNCANSSLKVLMELKEHAEEHDLPFYLGQAYKNLGEYYLLIGDSDKATPLLDESIKIFNTCKETPIEASQARDLRAISGGLQLLPKYVEVLLKAGRPGAIGKRNLAAILAWKSNRTDFWSHDDHFIPYTSCDSIIFESRQKVEVSRAHILDAKLRNLSSKLGLGEKLVTDLDVTEKIDEKSVHDVFTQKVAPHESYVAIPQENS